MGVAFGPFMPSEKYDRVQHANTVDGTYVDDFGQTLRVCTDQCGDIDARGIAIEDWTVTFGELQLTVFFADDEDFRALFSEHEEYKAYYPNKT